MRNVLLPIFMFFSFQAYAAFLPHMKVECQDVLGIFGPMNAMVRFELFETPTSVLIYTHIEANGKTVGFNGKYVGELSKLLPDGTEAHIGLPGLNHLDLVSKVNQRPLQLPNCSTIEVGN